MVKNICANLKKLLHQLVPKIIIKGVTFLAPYLISFHTRVGARAQYVTSQALKIQKDPFSSSHNGSKRGQGFRGGKKGVSRR